MRPEVDLVEEQKIEGVINQSAGIFAKSLLHQVQMGDPFLVYGYDLTIEPGTTHRKSGKIRLESRHLRRPVKTIFGEQGHP
ncbi:hypothetical protein D3C81_2104350 [compost metagenome]